MDIILKKEYWNDTREYASFVRPLISCPSCGVTEIV